MLRPCLSEVTVSCMARSVVGHMDEPDATKKAAGEHAGHVADQASAE